MLEGLDGIVHTLVLLVVLGPVLFGIAALRANILPRSVALLLTLFSLTLLRMVFDLDNPLVFLGAVCTIQLGWAWLGFALLPGSGTTAERAARVS